MISSIVSVSLGICLAAPAASEPTSPTTRPLTWPQVEYAFEIWDWVADYRDFGRFRARVEQARQAGFNTIEISVPWKDVQPDKDGPFNWASADQRINHVLSLGLALRVRINFSYAHPWPGWIQPQLSTRHDGKAIEGFMTVFDDPLNRLQAEVARAIAEHYRGRPIEWAPVFGMHTEVKFGDWLGYEPAGKAAFRAWLKKRYGTLDGLGEAWHTRLADWQKIDAPIPQQTNGRPDLSQPVIDWIVFREESLAAKMDQLLAAVRQGDPAAGTSVMLGESYRAESAAFANLAYWRYARNASRVLHSYDFFWHGPKDRQAAGLAADIMRGITGKPVVFEIDGPVLFEQFGYRDEDLYEIGRLALEHGAAGLNVANFCYSEKPLSAYPFMSRLGDHVRALNQRPLRPAPAPRRWYYVSKWANYLYREPTNWLHERQFANYPANPGSSGRVRIVTDENLLKEDTAGLEELQVAPLLVIDERVARKIRELTGRVRVVPDRPFDGAVIVEGICRSGRAGSGSR
jgi:hypothetical protein